jgi:glycosyltransferase involved in cell wall biosynthesis
VKEEAFPRAVIEAMACGRPVVVTQTGGAKEAVAEGLSGYVVPTGSPEALADRLRVLIADERLRARMGREGRRRAEALFGLASNTARTARVYA